jgi:shikimate dehydrogenase
VTPSNEPASPGVTWPSAASTVVATIGAPIRHSLSPALHNAAFREMGMDWVSVAFEVPAGRATGALEATRALGLRGLSVTTPHKEEAAGAVDERSALAERLGAVNCVTNTGGVLAGDSTDGAGLLAALARGHDFDPGGRRCLVVGAGGAARAVVLALADGGAAEVVVLNRDAGRARAAAALAGAAGRVGKVEDLSDVELVVQASSVGLADPEAWHPLVDRSRLLARQLVVDLVYHPARTALLTAAEEAGASVANGLGMLVHQAALALERWTGRDAPVEAMWAEARRLARR